jgi:bacteriocin resistance YdeI/OmpD-like protein/uncharacterized protein DUF1905
MRLRATVQLHGKTATGVSVPAELVAALGSGKRPAVRVSIAGHTWRSPIAPMGGEFVLGISAENRSLSGIAAGDTVDIDLELDTEPRSVKVPADLAEALDRDPEARRFFDSLSYSRQRRHVLAVEGARTATTRARRVDRSVTMLREGRTP